MRFRKSFEVSGDGDRTRTSLFTSVCYRLHHSRYFRLQGKEGGTGGISHVYLSRQRPVAKQARLALSASVPQKMVGSGGNAPLVVFRTCFKTTDLQSADRNTAHDEGFSPGLVTKRGNQKALTKNVLVETINNYRKFRSMPCTQSRLGAKKGETILIAEDEPVVRGVAEKFLADLGYTVVSALDGVEAAKVYSEAPGRFHLILSDVIMPICNGPEFVSEIRHLNQNQRVLYTSGFAADESGSAFAEYPCEQEAPFLPKPFSLLELASMIRKTLDTAA